MSLMEWSDERLSVHVDIIDRQHKKLVAIINNLHEAYKDNQAEESLHLLLAQLLHYTDYHFSTEERYFTDYDYPGRLDHKLQHDVLRDKVAELEERYEKKDRSMVSDVMAFLQSWLFDHILGSDKKFGLFLNQKGIQ